MMKLRGSQYKTLLPYLRIRNAVSTKISFGCLEDINIVQYRKQ